VADEGDEEEEADGHTRAGGTRRNKREARRDQEAGDVENKVTGKEGGILRGQRDARIWKISPFNESNSRHHEKSG
jgi:hypothetical protein